MFRYLEIMNFGNGDKRTSTLSSLYEKPEYEIGHIISDYKVILKLTEKEYEEIHKLLEYKGEYSYSELLAKVSILTERIENAIQYIKWHYDLGTKEETSFCILRDNLLEILGDKE